MPFRMMPMREVIPHEPRASSEPRPALPRILCGGRLAPEEFNLESTTVWSFPERGAWATHRGDYRGNWAPQIPRNLILRYTRPGDMVIDQMMGSGTTLIECRLLGRHGIGVDVNESAVRLARERLSFDPPPEDVGRSRTRQRTFLGDARSLDRIGDGSVELVATHPPYLNIISYSQGPAGGDLSRIENLEEFVAAMEEVASEALRVLKPGAHAAILMGDVRRKRLYVPLAYRTMQAFLDVGFELKEDIIKRQWNCRTTPHWKRESVHLGFHLIMHEHLFVFRKPGA